MRPCTLQSVSEQDSGSVRPCWSRATWGLSGAVGGRRRAPGGRGQLAHCWRVSHAQRPEL
eukprot:6507589-Pyramimonas_sp.AAC.1